MEVTLYFCFAFTTAYDVIHEDTSLHVDGYWWLMNLLGVRLTWGTCCDFLVTQAYPSGVILLNLIVA